MTGWSDLSLDLIALGCPLMRSHPMERVMDLFVYLGHGGVDSVIALAIIGYGVLARDRRTWRAGVAALLAVLVSGLLADLLKLVFHLPRPVVSWGYGFPSGHTSTAFALAGTLGRAFPVARPILSLLAVMAVMARLYERSHFVIDVLGGALLGTAVAIVIGRTVLGPSPRAGRAAWSRWAWALPVAVAAIALGFFAAYERALAAHHPSPAGPPLAVISFGVPEARVHLLEGWTDAEHRVETFPRTWAGGAASTLRLPSLPPASGYRIRMRVRPFVQRGGRALCQVVEVALNGVAVGRLLLERDWKEYEVQVEANLIRPGANELRFRFPAEGPDGQALHAAFASLEVFADVK